MPGRLNEEARGGGAAREKGVWRGGHSHNSPPLLTLMGHLLHQLPPVVFVQNQISGWRIHLNIRILPGNPKNWWSSCEFLVDINLPNYGFSLCVGSRRKGCQLSNLLSRYKGWTKWIFFRLVISLSVCLSHRPFVRPSDLPFTPSSSPPLPLSRS